MWKIHRKSLNYSFNLKILQTFIPTFIENSQKLVSDLSVNVGKTKEFDMLSYTTKSALNMICGEFTADTMQIRQAERHFFDFPFRRHLVRLRHKKRFDGRWCIPRSRKVSQDPAEENKYSAIFIRRRRWQNFSLMTGWIRRFLHAANRFSTTRNQFIACRSTIATKWRVARCAIRLRIW